MKATSTMRAETLQVPGARLYYEVRGSGPVLLMMPGGPADATTFRRIEDLLATRFTVVTYDPRGLSHSNTDEPIGETGLVETFADDAHRLLSKMGSEKAFVFANSGGATIALELLARHPEQLDTVVVHEPPTPDLLRDPERIRSAMEDVCDTYAGEGLWPAIQKFAAMAGIQGGPPPGPEGEPAPEASEGMAMMQRNMDLFFGPYIRNVARYRPDFAALKASPCRIVAAVGADSKGQLAHEGGLGLARILETQVVVFPGDHGGFDRHPDEFATRLFEVLDA